MNSIETHNTSRRYDLDWLRVLAFGVLIYFHTAVAFLPHGLPLTLNAEHSLVIAALVAFSHNFRLAVLFLVSGCGVYFALKTRDKSSFYRERTQRLLPPLLFGIAVLVPLMVYVEKKYLGEQFDSFLSFYGKYFTSGVYPEAYLSWHHFWFLAYLYLMCLIGWPVLRWMKRPRGQDVLSQWRDRFNLDGLGLYSLIVPLLLVEILLRPIFPGFRDLVSDWASFSHWFLIFLIGCWFASDRKLLNAALNLRTLSLFLAIMVTAVLFWLYWRPDQARLYPFAGQEISVLPYLLFSFLRIASAWLCILVCVGYAARYLNRPSTLLVKLNHAVYPVFCLHLPVLVVLEYFILPTSWSITTKFLLISNAAVVALWVLYLALKPVWFLRLFLGFREPKAR